MVMRGPEAQGGPLLRAVRARLRDPRDARPPAAHVPDPHVHELEVRPAPPARPAVPLRAHREVRGAVRRRHRPRRVHAARRRSCSTSSTASTTPVHRPAREADARGVRRARVRARGPAARPARERAQGDRAPADGRHPGGGLRPHRDRRGPARGDRCRCSSCARAGWSAARGSSSTRSRTSRRPALVARRRRAALRRRAADDVPKEILVPVEPDDLDLYEEFLALQPRREGPHPRPAARRQARAARDRRRSNARESFQRHKLRRASDHNARARALVALQEALDLPEAPLRIECFDISNLQGTEIVASMVVMEDGLAKRSDYRRFKVKTLDNQDDFASMEEVLTRRFRNYLRERDEGAHAGKRFAYPPNLLLIDGGKGQLNVAVRVLEELGLEDICVAEPRQAVRGGVPARPAAEPVRIPRDSEALYLLQQVRDEAHRFAITYHRQLRGKKMTALGARRRPRPRPGPQAAAAARSSARSRSSGSWPRRTCSRSRGCPTPVGTAVYRRLHSLDSRIAAIGATMRRRRDDGRRDDASRADGDRRTARRHDHHRHVGRRPVRGRARARGPRLLRDRQPAADAHREGRRAGAGRRHADPLRARRRRALRRLPRTTSRPRSASCARAGRHHADAVPRRRPTTCSSVATRRAAAAIRSPTATASATASPASARCSSRSRARPTSRRHVDAQRARAARPAARAVLGARVGRGAAAQRRVVRLQARAPARRRPRVRLPVPARTRTGSRSCGPLTGLDAPIRDYVLAQRGDAASSSTSSTASSRCCSPATSARARRTCRSRSAAPAAGTAAS